jgi:phage gpG-like protein
MRNAPYAWIHNKGWPIIPQRKFAELDSKTNAEIMRIFQTYLHFNP